MSAHAATALLRERIMRDHIALMRGWMQGMGRVDLAKWLPELR